MSFEPLFYIAFSKDILRYHLLNGNLSKTNTVFSEFENRFQL